MGAVADAALAAGGKVIGVMPQALIEREIAHTGLTEMHVTQGMHERKALMEQLSTGFVALPGGPGTLDEMIEQWTWGVLGIHTKPCGFLNIRGYFDPLRAMISAWSTRASCNRRTPTCWSSPTTRPNCCAASARTSRRHQSGGRRRECDGLKDAPSVTSHLERAAPTAPFRCATRGRIRVALLRSCPAAAGEVTDR